jgi:hypothetical protein
MSIALSNRIKLLEQQVAQLRAELDALGQRVAPQPPARQRQPLSLPKNG